VAFSCLTLISAIVPPSSTDARRRPNLTNRLGHTPGPDIAVTRQNQARSQTFQPRERRDRLLRVGRERRDLRAALAGRDRVGRDRVADEQRIEARDMECRAPWRVARNKDDARTAGHVERCAIAVGGDLGQAHDPEPAVRDREPEEAQQRRELGRAEALGRIRHLAACQGSVALVDPDRNGPLASKAFGEADVVAVAVGQHQGSDVGDRPAHRRQLGREIRVVAGNAGVDDRDLAGILDEVAVDDAVDTDSMDRRCDLHDGTILPRRRPDGCRHGDDLWDPT